MMWELENYNNWNMPFAKTVYIEGIQGGTHYHYLPRNSYKLEVDPSALFSILFLDEISFPSSGYSQTDLRTLNYTAMGG
jgi:hypothetical protein